MVQHVMAASTFKHARQPSSEVNAPVKLLVEYVVDCKTNEHPCSQTMEQGFDGKSGRRVQQKHQHHHHGRRRKVHVARLDRRSSGIVVQRVSPNQKTLSPVKQKAMKNVLEDICVEDTDQQTEQQM